MNFKHGYTVKANRRKGSPEWRAHCCWMRLRQRCDKPYGVDIANYRERGIRYDSRWGSFEAFIEDMGLPPEGGTLERLDNDGPYCKENCVWASRKVQSRNRRMRRILTLNGVSKPVWQWAEDLGVSGRLLRVRLNRGWSVERTLTEHNYGRSRKDCIRK